MKMGDNLPAVLTVEEAAVALRIGRSAAYEAVRTGDIPHVRIGKLIRIPRVALMEWLGQEKETTREQDETANLKAEGEFVSPNSPSNAKARNVNARAKTPTPISTR